MTGILEERVIKRTTRESVAATVDLITASESPVIRLSYFPGIHKADQVREALVVAAEQGKILEIVYPIESGCPIDTVTQGRLYLDEGLFSMPTVKAIGVERTSSGSSCLRDMPFTLDTMTESYFTQAGLVRINPAFLEQEPAGNSVIVYTPHQEGDQIVIKSVRYLTEGAAMQAEAYKKELLLWVENTFARVHPVSGR